MSDFKRSKEGSSEGLPSDLICADLVSAEDQEFIGELRTHFDVPPMSAQRRVEFAQELDARLARRRRVPLFVGVLGTGASAVAAAVIALLFWPVTSDLPNSEPAASSPVPIAAQVDDTWAEDLLFSSATTDVSTSSSDDEASDEFDSELPSDYAAIGSIFLDG